jgi:hypothetical protein
MQGNWDGLGVHHSTLKHDHTLLYLARYKRTNVKQIRVQRANQHLICYIYVAMVVIMTPIIIADTKTVFLKTERA